MKYTFCQQLLEVNEKMNNVERFAKETADKCAEISERRGSSKRCKQIDQLKESNILLKDVNSIVNSAKLSRIKNPILFTENLSTPNGE